MLAQTMRFVDSSTGMKPPVGRLRRFAGDLRSRRAEPHPADLVETEPVRGLVAEERHDVEAGLHRPGVPMGCGQSREMLGLVIGLPFSAGSGWRSRSTRP